MKQPPFRLYPEEQHWWSMNDYGAVLSVMERLQAKTVLEFGPGWSTRALIEGGATAIDACEDNPNWFAVHAARLVPLFPDIVTLHPFSWVDPLTIPAIDDKWYDLALIDGPYGTLQRPAVLAYCLARCTAVLLPTEEIAYGKGALRPHIERLAEQFGRDIEWMETGPLSGGFALLTRPGRSATTSLQIAQQTFPGQASTVSIDTVTEVEPTQQVEATTSGFAASNEVEKPEAPRRRRRRGGRKGGGA